MLSRIHAPLAAALVITAPLAGQQHQHRAADSTAGPQMQMHDMMGQGMGGMMSGMEDHVMMRIMRFAPANVLRHADVLSLTEPQISTLERLRGKADSMAPMMEGMQGMQGLMANLQRAFDAEPVDAAAIENAVQALASMHSRMQVRQVTNAAAVRALLTAPQREQLMMLPAMQSNSCMMGNGGGAPAATHHPQPDPNW